MCITDMMDINATTKENTYIESEMIMVYKVLRCFFRFVKKKTLPDRKYQKLYISYLHFRKKGLRKNKRDKRKKIRNCFIFCSL